VGERGNTAKAATLFKKKKNAQNIYSLWEKGKLGTEVILTNGLKDTGGEGGVTSQGKKKVPIKVKTPLKNSGKENQCENRLLQS